MRSFAFFDCSLTRCVPDTLHYPPHMALSVMEMGALVDVLIREHLPYELDVDDNGDVDDATVLRHGSARTGATMVMAANINIKLL